MTASAHPRVARSIRRLEAALDELTHALTTLAYHVEQGRLAPPVAATLLDEAEARITAAVARARAVRKGT